MSSPVAAEQASIPLCVDLDGTLIKTDMLWESMVRLLRRNPLYIILVLIWLARGRAHLKKQIALRTDVVASCLPACTELLGYLRNQKALGRRIFLVTASDQQLANSAGACFPVFNEVLASDGKLNLRGHAKAETLVARFGERGFDYAGNSSVDYAVWRRARKAIVVNAPRRVEKGAKQCSEVDQVLDRPGSTWQAWLRSLRPHQWVKNLIVFVPLITGHKVTELALVLEAMLAFVAFCGCASGVYLLNDLFDLDADRQHPTKAARPFASGELPISLGLAVFPVLIVISLSVALSLSWGFVAVLGLYLLLTTAYSWRLKEFPLVDVFCLAALYTLRLIGGHEATGVKYSSWLLMFSMFIFLSLALLKRFVELQGVRLRNDKEVLGRGYAASDLNLVAIFGICVGCLAVLVLALYVNSNEVLQLYSHPTFLLLICPLLMFWIARVWLLAHRGQMHQDPIVFALKDAPSYIIGVLALTALTVAAGH